MKKKPETKIKLLPFRGFTLIELIMGLLLSAILIAIMLPLIGTSIEGSRKAINSLPDTQNLRNQMEIISSLYRNNYTDNLEALHDQIENTLTSSDPTQTITWSSEWMRFNSQGQLIPSPNQRVTLRLTLTYPNGESLTSYFFKID